MDKARSKRPAIAIPCGRLSLGRDVRAVAGDSSFDIELLQKVALKLKFSLRGLSTETALQVALLLLI